MIDSMGAARRLASTRLAAFLVCAGGVLLALPAAGLADNWSTVTETVPQSSGALSASSTFDASTNLTAIWSGPGGIGASVRATTWQATADSVDATPNPTQPDVAMSGSTSLATWVGSDGNVYASVGSLGAWSAAAAISSDNLSTSAQAAVVNGTPTIFYLDGGLLQVATQSGGLWSAQAAPTGAPTGAISGLRVAVDSTGAGAAAWIDGTNVETALIAASGTWTVSSAPISTLADGTTTLAVAARAVDSAVAWNEPTDGVQVAVSTGGDFTIDGTGTAAGATLPGLGFDSTGRLVAAYVVGSSVKGEVRAPGGGFGSETTLGTAGSGAPSVSGGILGDAAVVWDSAAGVQMRAFDSTPPTVTINAPSDLSPGTKTWTATASDLWSPTLTFSWSWTDGGPTASGASVQHSDPTPGQVTATVVVTDVSGNQTTSTKTVTITPVAPTVNTGPTITVGTSVVSGGVLTAHAGSWSGNPTPTLAEQWQRCTAGGSCNAIASATAGTYTLTTADVGFRIRLHETASNTGGSASSDSAETAVVGPTASGQPSLTAGASPIADGVILTAATTAGNWGGATGLSFTYRFQRCNGGCTIVQESSATTYTLTAADVGATMEVSVIAKAGPVDGLFSQTATSTSTSTLPVAPKSTSPPTLSGVARDTQVLTASSPDSSWDGATGLDKTYMFQRCNTAGANCVVAQNTSSSTYTLTSADLGKFMLVVAQASSNSSAPISSSPSASTTAVVPSAITTSPAAPSGTPQDGQTLTSATVSWTNQGSLAISYQWMECSAATGCDPIGGATASTYTLQAADVGMTIYVVTTATVGPASASVSSASTAAVAPLNSGAAGITSPAQVRDGQTFNASSGAWDGASGLAFTYQWKRCDTAGANCSAIGSATSAGYTAGALDVGGTLRVTVSASKNGSAVASSPDSSQTIVVAPLSTGTPGLTGAAHDGQTLTAASPDSDWDAVSGLTKTYQFFRCDSNGANCTSTGAPSATATYVLNWNDIGSTIEVVALASKGGSTATPSSSSTVTPIVQPTLTTAPAAPTGGAQDGQTLTAGNGAWVNQGHLGFKYQFFRCSPGCTSLGAASSTATYVLQPADVGNTIQVVVTAFIGAGAASATSSNSLVVAPLNTARSAITPPAQQQDGQTYTASDGAWNGATGLAFTYQWKRCNQTGASCSAIQGATSKTYQSGPLDVGSTLRATVSASKGGSAVTPSTGDSDQTAVVAPRNTTLPTATGTTVDGSVLTASASSATAGAWDGAAGLAFSYQWLRCNASGGSCVAITTNGTGSTYTLTPDDVAAAGDSTHARITIRVRVIATINGVSTSADSSSTPPIDALPTQNTTLPSVAGNDQVAGIELTAVPGAWSGTGVSDQSFQWVRCDPPFQPANCTNIGAPSLSARYVLASADVGHYVSFIETVVNRLGATATRTAVFSKPVISNVMDVTVLPVVSPPDGFVDGKTLTTSDGAYTPAGDLSLSYKWLRCPGDIDTSGSADACPIIASGKTYTLTPADVGSYVLSEVHAVLSQDGLQLGVIDVTSDLEGATQVSAAPPVNTARPTIGGSSKQDSPLTSTPGTWNGTNTAAVPMTFTYQWLRCDASGGACQAIAGATQTSYTPTATDVGSTIVVRVTAKNSGGSQSATSLATGAITGLPATSTGPSIDTTPPGVGTAGGPPHPTVEPDKTKPVLTISLVGGGALAGGTTLSISVTCPKTEKTCKSVFHLLATLKKPTGKALGKPVTVAINTATFTGGQKKLIKLKLSSAARNALKQSLKLKVTLTASVTDAAGNVTPKETKGFTLRWKKP